MTWRTQKIDEPSREVTGHEADGALAARAGRSNMDNLVNIGKSVQIKGELTASEDLTIDGVLEGKIFMKDHDLAIGPNGTLQAEIRAKSVTVLGKLVGNVKATEKVEVAATGTMEGDIQSPRVLLADGARFKGSIDMEGRPSTAAAAAGASSSSSMTQTPPQPREPRVSA
jgi:cytoskeletal protein CcmA (bactofilin family)